MSSKVGAGVLLPVSKTSSAPSAAELRSALRAIAGVPGPPGPDDPTSRPEGLADSDEIVTRFRYGDVAFGLPTTWLRDYVEHRRWQPAAEAVDTLWSRYLSRETPSSDAARGLLGCWNVPATARNGVEWSSFWSDGGPINVFEHMVRLIYAYREHARDRLGTTDWCDGLPEFLEGVLKGEQTETREEVSCPGGVRFLVLSEDSAFSAEESEWCVGERVTCGSGSTNDDGTTCGNKADDWRLSWAEDTHSWLFKWEGEREGSPSVTGGCDAAASGANLTIWLHGGAAVFGSVGFLVDWLLWWARAALDYALEDLSRLSHLDAASRLSRFALLHVATPAALAIHELGHVYIGRGGHCSRGCCMTIAAAGWKCAVIANLGLPTGVGWPSYGGERRLSASCSDGDYTSRCFVADAGHAGGAYVFESQGTGC